ncbi:related to thioredoxin-like protein [Rhynchosporium secalis]|uniref:Related to thioredoxin-like protein n=1 Tax=Rhynchosporium secalis TaxID=38038 RepID=A0A1E1ME73_RHYSE|nr:related to thioredoxin-like protein [Rhynchosporium secalis]
MSKTIQISSSKQLSDLVQSSQIVVTDFYADWCGPCKTIAPLYEQLSASLSRPNHITFVKVNGDTQKEIASKYAVTAMPTFIIFKSGQVVEKIKGADPRKLQDVVKKLAAEAEGGPSSSGFGGATGSGSSWRVGALPRGYSDVTDQVDLKGLELLNADREFGSVRTLVDSGKPTGLQKGKVAAAAGKDWVESDTDEQLMLFMPFQCTLKVHTLQVTSLPPAAGEDDDDEVPMRPKTVQIYTNRAHILGFEEADDIPATQSITLEAKDWDETGTATLSLRFVKFQNISSLVIFIVDGDGDGERVRVDRVRVIGETGEKRDLGKLEKIGDEHGE